MPDDTKPVETPTVTPEAVTTPPPPTKKEDKPPIDSRLIKGEQLIVALMRTSSSIQPQLREIRNIFRGLAGKSPDVGRKPKSGEQSQG